MFIGNLQADCRCIAMSLQQVSSKWACWVLLGATGCYRALAKPEWMVGTHCLCLQDKRTKDRWMRLSSFSCSAVTVGDELVNTTRRATKPNRA